MTLVYALALRCLVCFHGFEVQGVDMTEPILLPAVLPTSRPQILDPAGPGQRLVAAFLAGRSPQTVRAYRQDLFDFAGFTGTATLAEAAQQFLAAGPAAGRLAFPGQAGPHPGPGRLVSGNRRDAGGELPRRIRPADHVTETGSRVARAGCKVNSHPSAIAFA